MVDLDDWSESNIQANLELREDCQKIIDYFLDYKGSIRQCADWVGMPRSRVHRYIHSYISYYWYEAYCRIKNILSYNSKYRFKPRAQWERGRHRG